MAKEKLITIKLTVTQRACLLKALEELSDEEGGQGCNDLFEGDKLYLLSEQEQLEAVRMGEANKYIQEENAERLIPFTPEEEIQHSGSNFSATDYLKKVIEKQ